MRDYDFKLTEPSESSRSSEKGCRCSVAVGFLLVLLAIAIAVGVGIIVHFAGKPADVTCNYNLEGLAVSETNILQCAGLAAGNNRNICDACPSAPTSPPSPTQTPVTTTTKPVVDLSRLPKAFEPLVYEVFLRPDFYSQEPSEFYVTGNTTIHVHCHETRAKVILHARDMELTEGQITVMEENETEDIFHSYELNAHFATVTITTRKPMMHGRNYTIAIGGFKYSVRSDFLGFYHTWYKRNGEKVYIVNSDLEPAEARKIFPCFDEPSFKAVFDFTIARKPGKFALTNAELEKTIQGTDGWLYDVFKSSPKMSTYLIHIVVCDYHATETVSSNGVQMKLWTRPEAVNQTAFAVDLSSRVLTHFEEYFNIPYPLAKMDSIAYSQYLWTAMENWGLIVYREDVFLFDESRGSYLDKIDAALVIAHEIAHNWFGNLVSPAWWDDLWLNEGFATYGEFLGANLAEPTWKMDDFLAYQATGLALKADGLVSSHPMYIPGVTDLGQILNYFDNIIYRKGCALIKMMEFIVGKGTFRKGLENYLKSLSYDNAEHNDLWKAISEQAMVDNKPITDVKGIMDTWIGQMNYPVVNVEWQLHGQIKLTQKRYLENPNATDPHVFKPSYGYKWNIPFTYTTSTEKHFNKSEVDIIMIDLEDGSVSVSSDKIPSPSGNEWIVGNLQYLGYYLVNYDERNWNAIIDQLKTDPSVIATTNRVQIIHDTWALARSGDLNLEIPLRLFEYIGMEDDMSPWFAFADEMENLQNLLYTDPIYGQFQTKMQDILNNISPRTGQDVNSAGVQDKHMYLSCLFEVESRITTARTTFDTDNVTPIDPTFASTVYCTTVKHGGLVEWNYVYARLNKENFLAERLRLLKALTCAKQPWLIAKTQSLMLNPEEVYANELWRIVQDMATNKDALCSLWDFYREHFSIIMQRSGGYWGQQPLLEIANSFNTNQRLREIEEFGKASHLEGSQFYQQAREKVINNIEFKDRLIPAIRQWLNP